MVRRYLLMIAGCLIAIPGVVMADLADPGIGVKGGDPPDPLSLTTQLGQVQPTSVNCDSSGDCTFIFLNDSGQIITGLDFSLTILPDLVSVDHFQVVGTGPNGTGSGGIFSIQQTGAGYFLNEALTYNDNTGALNFDYSGVKKADQDEGCPSPDCEVNEQEGIPAGGIFTITLNGWVANLTDPGTPVYNGLPGFTDTFTTAPEPSMSIALLIGLLLTAAAFEARRRRASASRA